MFKAGEIVVYPGCGLGRILSIDEAIIDGKVFQAYVFKPIDRDTEIYIPLQSVKKIGIRPLISKEKLPTIYAILTQEEVKITEGNWNKRFKEYTEKLKSGNIIVLATLVKELHTLSKRKNLSFGEKKIFEKAKELLVLELAYCEDCTPKEMEQKLMELLKNS